MRQVSVRVSDEEAEQIERLASADGRSITNYVRRVLTTHLEQNSPSTNGKEHP